MFYITRPSKDQIESFVSDLARRQFSYSHVGASVYGVPNGYARDHNRVLLGTGEQVWKRAVEGISRWEMFNLGWTQLCWPSAPIRWGTDVAVLIRHYGFYSLNPSRIVYVKNEDDETVQRYGFAYGTLTGHAECGEERFMVEWHKKEDTVHYDLLAFSRPSSVLARMGYPVVRGLQKRFGRDSMASMVRWCRG